MIDSQQLKKQIYFEFPLGQGVSLLVIDKEFINPFQNLDETTTVTQIDEVMENMTKHNIKAIVNCIDDDQSMKAYGLQFLNIHQNFEEQLDAAKLFIHFWTRFKKSTVAIYCDHSYTRSMTVLKYFLINDLKMSQESVDKISLRTQQQSIPQKEIQQDKPIDWGQVFANDNVNPYNSRFLMSPLKK